ncbi:Ig-like domain-containing protein [bacterium]|nr:T9SS type A sorting domain-containing protein [bacterium]MBU3956573.1 Ig-like domain-containing protein [bacterium]
MKRSLIILPFLGQMALAGMAGGDYTIGADSINGGGAYGNAVSSGGYVLSQNFGQTSGVKVSSTPETELYAGFLGAYMGDGLPPYIYSSNVFEGFRGVHSTQTIAIAFGEDMDVATIANSFRLITLRDNSGNRVTGSAAVVGGEASFDYLNGEFNFSPDSPLKNNYTYVIDISTDLRDEEGYFALEGIKKWFGIVMNPVDDNICLLREDASSEVDKNTRANFGRGALSDFSYLKISSSPATSPIEVDSEKVRKANEKQLRNNGIYSYPVTTYEIVGYKSSGEKLTASFNKPVVIEMSYKDDSNDGIVDDSNPPLFVKELAIYWLNEEHSLWVKLPSSEVKTENKIVSAEINHLSVYALMGSASYDLSKAHAFPVPYIASKMPKKITFTEIGNDYTIKIFTISGELVRKLNFDISQEAGQYVWDVKNDKGQNVFSGVYVYLITNQQQKKTGKIMIIR